MARYRLLLAAVVALVVGAVAAGLVVGARHAPRAGAPARPAARLDAAPGDPAPSDPAPSDPGMRGVLAGLDRARAAAYADPVLGDPDDWAAPSCPCHAEDARRLRVLARDGLALRSAAVTLVAVVPVTASPRVAGAGLDGIDLLVVDRTAAYAAVDRTGRVARRWPATGPRRWRIRLVHVAGRWRIGSIARAP